MILLLSFHSVSYLAGVGNVGEVSVGPSLAAEVEGEGLVQVGLGLSGEAELEVVVLLKR